MNNTVVFITALRLEFNAVVAHINNRKSHWVEGRDSTTGEYGPWQIVVYLQTEPGNDEALLVTNAAIQKDDPSYLFFVGVAGGIKDVKVGDVVIARKIIGYESAKVGDNLFKARPDVEKLPKPLARLANHIISKNEWVKKITDPNPLLQAHLSPIASGQKVIVSKEFLKQLEIFAGDAVAVEMEGIGFSRAIADGAMVQGIVIRGISDLCDPDDKNAKNDKERQPIAAHNAAAFAFAMLDELSPEVVSPLLTKEGPGVVFTIPFARNPHFVGRQDLLTQLHSTLATQRLVALCGLGGVGKTQVAVEYAYRQRQDYSAVLWLSLSSELEVHSQFATLAEGLGIPRLQEQAQVIAQIVAQQVKDWLASHHDWLLLVDNADEIDGLKSFRPLLPATLTGRVLFTTRQHQLPLSIECLSVEILTEKEGAGFIVQQVHRKVTAEEVVQQSEYSTAQELSRLLGGLPLALTQAAAYMREHSRSCTEYMELYQNQTYQKDLLNHRGDLLNETDHPEPVAITWNVSLQKIQENHPKALDLLCCCAVLQPDGIPEEVLMKAVAVNELQLDKLLKPLLGYSLLTRHRGQKAVSIHRLIRDVLRLKLGSKKLLTTVARLVTAVEKLFPEESNKQVAQVKHWQQCEPLLSSALACAEEIKQFHLKTDTAARLLERLADYLRKKKADYKQSLQWYKLALAIYKQVGGKEELEISIRNRMMDVYWRTGDYKGALSLGQETLEMSKGVSGENCPNTAETLRFLGWIYYLNVDYVNALEYCDLARRVNEQVHGEEHYNTATCLNNLARLYHAKAEYEKAWPLAERSFEINKRELTEEHTHTTMSLNTLAMLHQAKGDYAEAQKKYDRVYKLRKQLLGEEHPNVARSLNYLAELYRAQGEYSKALECYVQALAIRKRVLGEEHPDTATSIANLAGLYQAQGEYKEPLPLYQRALDIRKRVGGERHPDTATSLTDLAWLHQVRGEYDEALPLYEQALEIRKQVLGKEHLKTAISIENLGWLFKATGDDDKALPWLNCSLKIKERVLGPNHPQTAIVVHKLAIIYRDQGDFERALSDFERALTIRTQQLYPDHPRVAQSCHDSGICHRRQGQYDKALGLLERALKIRKDKLGPDHPDTARTRSELALVYQAQGQAEQAKECYETALATLRTRLPHHPDTQRVAENYQRG